jgi:hypothetical protein
MAKNGTKYAHGRLAWQSMPEIPGAEMSLNFWWERRRPAPLDVLTPAMQWGRLRTWINAVLKRPELLRDRIKAWQIYEPTVRTVAHHERPKAARLYDQLQALHNIITDLDPLRTRL